MKTKEEIKEWLDSLEPETQIEIADLHYDGGIALVATPPNWNGEQREHLEV